MLTMLAKPDDAGEHQDAPDDHGNDPKGVLEQKHDVRLVGGVEEKSHHEWQGAEHDRRDPTFCR